VFPQHPTSLSIAVQGVPPTPDVPIHSRVGWSTNVSTEVRLGLRWTYVSPRGDLDLWLGLTNLARFSPENPSATLHDVTDSRLQDLERAWRASGAVDDEAAYLRERVRVGELNRQRLELAAWTGHVGALLVCGSDESAPQRSFADLHEVGRYDPEALVRVFYLLMRRGRDRLLGELAPPLRDFVTRSLAANAACMQDLSLESRGEAERLADEVDHRLLASETPALALPEGLEPAPPLPPSAQVLLEAIASNARALSAAIDWSPKEDAWDMDDWQTRLCLNASNSLRDLAEALALGLADVLQTLTDVALRAPASP